MDKKLIAIFSLMFLCQVGFADTCPSVKDIKNNSIKGWKAFDSEEDKPLTAERETRFKNEMESFILAEYVKEHNVSTIHCYYRNKDGSNMEAYLTKDNFVPNNAQKYWYQVSGAMQCAAGQAKCEFQSNSKESQFARR